VLGTISLYYYLVALGLLPAPHRIDPTWGPFWQFWGSLVLANVLGLILTCLAYSRPTVKLPAVARAALGLFAIALVSFGTLTVLSCFLSWRDPASSNVLEASVVMGFFALVFFALAYLVARLTVRTTPTPGEPGAG
jgi:hypothetical protein